jgi:hypothetical protein
MRRSEALVNERYLCVRIGEIEPGLACERLHRLVESQHVADKSDSTAAPCPALQISEQPRAAPCQASLADGANPEFSPSDAIA